MIKAAIDPKILDSIKSIVNDPENSESNKISMLS